MSIRLPLRTVLDVNNSTLQSVPPASLLGGVAFPFQLPQDTDNVLVKLEASTVAGGVSATFQTTDNGGLTWYDVARTSIVSNTAGSVLAQWLSIPVCGVGMRTTGGVSSVGTGTSVSVLGATGSSGASTLGQMEVSGLPIMGIYNRIFLRYTGVTSVTSERVQVSCNSQSATA